jgi:predicted membrane chloride channel (bestrophin family)
MILYFNKAPTWRLIVNHKGSVLFGLFPIVLWTFVVSAILYSRLHFIYLYQGDPEVMKLKLCDRRGREENPDIELNLTGHEAQCPSIKHPFALQVYMFVIGFQTIFRVNNANWRFWEGRSQAQAMLARWQVAFLQIKAFCFASSACYKGTAERRLAVRQEMLTFLNNQATFFTLLTGFAINTLSEVKTDDPNHWQELEYRLKAKDPHRVRIVEPFTERARFEQVPYRDQIAMVGKPSRRDMEHLRHGKDKVMLIMMWICEELSAMVQHPQKILMVPPPIVSRSYQELSNGVLGFEQSFKIALIPFPFIWHQVAGMSNAIMVIFAPILGLYYTDHYILSPVLTSLVLMGFFGLNATAVQLEEPFGTDSNDLPLLDMQFDFCGFVRQTLDTDLPDEEKLGLGLTPKPPDPAAEERERKRLEQERLEEEAKARGEVKKKKSNTRMTMADLGLDNFAPSGANMQKAKAAMSIFVTDSDVIVPPPPGEPEVEKLNKKLEALNLPIFARWLDQNLLTDYTLEVLERKFNGDKDVAVWVYRMIRDAFPGDLPRDYRRSANKLEGELDEVSQEQISLVKRQVELKDEVKELQDELDAIRGNHENMTPDEVPEDWFIARRAHHDLEYRAEIVELEAANERLKSDLDMAKMEARTYCAQPEDDDIEEEIIQLAKDKCRLERGVRTVAQKHLLATEELDKRVREQTRGQREAIQKAKQEFMDTSHKFEMQLDAVEKKQREELTLAEAEAEKKRASDQVAKAAELRREAEIEAKRMATIEIMGTMQDLTAGYPGETLADVLGKGHERELKRKMKTEAAAGSPKGTG